MDGTESLLVEALRYGIKGEAVPWSSPPDRAAQLALVRLARAQAVQPLIAQSLFLCPATAGEAVLEAARKEAKAVTTRQAVRTAEFLLLLRELSNRELYPAVLKGIVCRSLYPEPEQRASTDEDLLISPEKFSAYHEALLACGLQMLDPTAPTAGADEVTYVDPDRDLYVELHMRLLPSGSDAYGDCNSYFTDVLSRTVTFELYGTAIHTLAPTDHVLFLLCHAYKHILHGGVGIRQICDICLFARQYDGEIDWKRVRAACEEMKIETLSAAFFRIGERHLDIQAPVAFADLSPDEEPLLHDCLTGGLYGANDRDRLHSSTMTLEAVAADRTGRRSLGAIRSLFLPAESLSGRFHYLRKRPWLLPAAWAQRIFGYVFREKSKPANTLNIGRNRIELLRQYGVLP